MTLDGIDFYDHERGVLIGKMPEAGCTRRWPQLRDAALKVGRWPIFIMDGAVLESIGVDERSATPERILAEAEVFRIDEWLKDEREHLKGAFDEQDREQPHSPAERSYSESHPDLLDQLPPPEVQFPALLDLAILEGHAISGTNGLIMMALLPTTQSWQVHAYLPCGGWNCYPYDRTCAGILKSWHERFGAEVIALSNDQLVLQVPHRVEDNQTVSRLAEEQFYFCPDLVEQGHETVDFLAADLRRHLLWTFWWD